MHVLIVGRIQTLISLLLSQRPSEKKKLDPKKVQHGARLTGGGWSKATCSMTK